MLLTIYYCLAKNMYITSLFIHRRKKIPGSVDIDLYSENVKKNEELSTNIISLRVLTICFVLAEYCTRGAVSYARTSSRALCFTTTSNQEVRWKRQKLLLWKKISMVVTPTKIGRIHVRNVLKEGNTLSDYIVTLLNVTFK